MSLTTQQQQQEEQAASKRLVGQRLRAVESPRVLLGETQYVDDIQLPGMIYASFVRSSVPHARLKRIDLSKAMKEEGVIGGVIGRDVVQEIRPFPIFAAPKGLKEVAIYPIAVGKIRFAGEIVAALVSRDRYLAEDALEQVEVEYDHLEPVIDPERAPSQNSYVIEGWKSNIAYSTELRNGEVETAFAEADHVLSERFHIQRQYGSPMEPRAILAKYEQSTGELTVWSATQWPHMVKTVLADMLGIGEQKLRVIAPDVGGGFGNKQDVYPEEVLCAYLAKRFGKPVKWTASRTEDISSTVHARDQVHYVEIAARKDGTITAIKDRIIADLGAFHIMSLGPQLVSVYSLPGPYAVRNWLIKMDCVTTNKTPVGAYRGFGQGEANFVIERAIDLLARDLKLDPIRVRMKNLIQADEFPYRNALGSVYDSGDYPEALRRAVKLSRWDEYRKSNKKRRDDGLLLGIGVAFCLESTGVAPSKKMAVDGFKVYSGYESVSIRVERSGDVSVFTGLSPHGQGLDTTLSQVCADELGIGVDKIRVFHGDTRSAPYGFGTWGSRSAITGSSALVRTAEKIREKAAKISSHVLGAEDIEYSDGRFRSREKKPERSITLKEIAEIAYDGHDLPSGVEPGLEATTFYDPPAVSYSYQVHVPIVGVDLETGSVKILSYSIVHDCGVMINPTIVEGQIHGGVAQGIASALLEEISYGEDGQLLSPTFIDYLLPTSGDVPPVMAVEHMITPTPINPLGVKGMGEGGAIAPPAALVNAIENALEGFDVKITETPVTPEKLRGLLNK